MLFNLSLRYKLPLLGAVLILVTATALSAVFSGSSLSSSTFFSEASMSCSNSRKTRFAMMVGWQIVFWKSMAAFNA